MLACAIDVHHLPVRPHCSSLFTCQKKVPRRAHLARCCPCFPFLHTLDCRNSVPFCSSICVTVKVPAVSVSAFIIMHRSEIHIRNVLCRASCRATLDNKSHVLSSQRVSPYSYLQSTWEPLIFLDRHLLQHPLRQTCGDLLRSPVPWLHTDLPSLGPIKPPLECTYPGIDVALPALKHLFSCLISLSPIYKI